MTRANGTQSAFTERGWLAAHLQRAPVFTFSLVCLSAPLPVFLRGCWSCARRLVYGVRGLMCTLEAACNDRSWLENGASRPGKTLVTGVLSS